LSSADHVLVLDAGAMQHQGTLDEVVASGYQFNHAMKVDKDADVAESGAKKPEAATPAKAHVAQKEKAEPPIAKSSLGWTPYRFYMNMAGWSGSIVVLVSHLHLNELWKRIHRRCFKGSLGIYGVGATRAPGMYYALQSLRLGLTFCFRSISSSGRTTLGNVSVPGSVGMLA
jgi:hypothetical protein